MSPESTPSLEVSVGQNEHVYVICCRLEVGDNVIFGRNVKTQEGYLVVNFEVASSSSFRHVKKIIS